jgi:8-oxo-dGTP diphosphatase
MNKTKVQFYEDNTIDDDKLEFAVILAKYQNKWIYCKHKERDTWEIPGGHREKDEEILNTAKRELKEETGAEKFTMIPVAVYSVTVDNHQHSTQSVEVWCSHKVLQSGSIPFISTQSVGVLNPPHE